MSLAQRVLTAPRVKPGRALPNRKYDVSEPPIELKTNTQFDTRYIEMPRISKLLSYFKKQGRPTPHCKKLANYLAELYYEVNLFVLRSAYELFLRNYELNGSIVRSASYYAIAKKYFVSASQYKQIYFVIQFCRIVRKLFTVQWCNIYSSIV